MAISLHLNYRPDIIHEFELFKGNYEDVDETYIKECRLLEIPIWLYQLTNLVHLSFANNFVKDVHYLGVLVHLKYLDASDNQIEILQDSFFQLIRLKSLDLSGNRIKIIPDKIEVLNDLEVLIFDRNCLEEIPKSLTRCSPILMAFEYCHNLSKIPTNLFNMKHLEHLSLKCCNLNVVPGYISPKMKTLILKGNKLINNLPYSYRRFLEDSFLSNFFLIGADDVNGFSEQQTENIKSSSANYITIGTGLINLPSNISQIFRTTDNSSMSLRELTLRNASQIKIHELLPKSLKVSLNEPSGICDCGTNIFSEAVFVVFYDKDHPNYNNLDPDRIIQNIGIPGVPWSKLLCSKLCCDKFFKDKRDDIHIIF